MSIFSKTFAKLFLFPLTLTVFHEFPRLFSDFFIKIFSPAISQVSDHPEKIQSVKLLLIRLYCTDWGH